MNSKSIPLLILINTLYLVYSSCHENPERDTQLKYQFLEPQYEKIKLIGLEDTLHLTLDDTTYNSIKSINTFIQGGKEYIYFHDKISETINVYNLNKKKFVKKIAIKRFVKDDELYKTSVAVFNFDSIFIINNHSIHLIDSSGKKLKKVDFIDTPFLIWAFVKNDNPLIVKNKKCYTAIRNFYDVKSLNIIRKWKNLYEFDLETNSATTHYNFPNKFLDSLYEHIFMSSSYCYNNKGNFVFSFGGDTVIYETNLTAFHSSYSAKSHLENSDQKEILILDKGIQKSSTKNILKHIYSSIYFDPHKKRYLRICRSLTDESSASEKEKQYKQSIIILDENFKIVGESVLEKNIGLGAIFFTSNGRIYAPLNTHDEYVLHFIRLDYIEK